MNRANVHLAAGQKSHRPGQIDDEPPLDAAVNHPLDPFGALESPVETGPSLLAPGLFPAEPDQAVLVFVTLDKDIDLVTCLDLAVLAGSGELPRRYPAFRFQTDVDHHHVAFDADDGALDDPAFKKVGAGKGFFQKFGEIFVARRDCFLCSRGEGCRSHQWDILNFILVLCLPTGCLRWSFPSVAGRFRRRREARRACLSFREPASMIIRKVSARKRISRRRPKPP